MVFFNKFEISLQFLKCVKRSCRYFKNRHVELVLQKIENLLLQLL